MKRERTKTMKELMAFFIDEMGLRQGLDQERVTTFWDDMLGPSVAAATKQKRLNDGKLFVKTTSSAVRNWLFTERTALVKKINEAMGKMIVTDIILY
jgi:predicted nucleic acid-binding Zn ribbon protein